MGSLAQNRFFHGIMLPQICNLIGVTPTKQAINTLKALLKKRDDVESLTHLNAAEMKMFIDQIAIFFAMEFAFVLDLPGEERSHEKDIKQFLEETV